MSARDVLEPPTQATDGVHPVTMPWSGVVLIAATMLVLAQLLPSGFVRAVAVVPIMLLLPGWAASCAVFGRDRPTDPVLLGSIGVALSMSVLIANGLTVNAIGLRLDVNSLVVGPLVASTVLLLIGRARGADTSLRLPEWTRARLILRNTAVLVVALGLAAAAVAYAAHRLPAPAAAPFMEVSFGAQFAARGQPMNVVPAQIVTLPVEARVHGRPAREYRIVTTVDGSVVGESHATVGPNDWAGTVDVVAPTGRCLHRVEIEFVPEHGSGARAGLDTYLDVTRGPQCRP